MKFFHVTVKDESYPNEDIADMLEEVADQVRVTEDKEGVKHKGMLRNSQGHVIGEWVLHQEPWVPKKYA